MKRSQEKIPAALVAPKQGLPEEAELWCCGVTAGYHLALGGFGRELHGSTGLPCKASDCENGRSPKDSGMLAVYTVLIKWRHPSNYGRHQDKLHTWTVLWSTPVPVPTAPVISSLLTPAEQQSCGTGLSQEAAGRS